MKALRRLMILAIGLRLAHTCRRNLCFVMLRLKLLRVLREFKELSMRGLMVVELTGLSVL